MTDMPPTPEDRIADDLVARARTDREAFGELYDMIYPPVFRYCLHRSCNRGLAEDITSTVFLSVAEKIATFGGRTFQGFRRWVFKIATNEINAFYRKTTRRDALLAAAAHAGQLRGQTGGGDVEQNLDSEVLHAAILKLSERAQAIVTMRFFSELPYEDIADILSISPGSARTAASRAIAELRGNLGCKT